MSTVFPSFKTNCLRNQYTCGLNLRFTRFDFIKFNTLHTQRAKFLHTVSRFTAEKPIIIGIYFFGIGKVVKRGER